MSKWVDVTDSFSERARHYKNLYMEINEVFDNVVEVSLFSCDDGPFEIYFSYDYFYGIIYTEAEKAHELRSEIKKELEAEYRKNKKPPGEFVNSFAEKYDVRLPNDIFFEFDLTGFADNMPF